MKEQTEQTKIIRYLEGLGWYVIKVIASSKSGVADLVCCANGRFVTIEVKRDKNHKPSLLQAYKLRKARESGGVAFSCHSFQDLIPQLRFYNLHN